MKTNYLTLCLLALIFAMPGLSAFLYYRHPQWLAAETTNKGKLLNPPLLFADIAAGKPKWRLIYWNPKPCDAACLQEVDLLARVRLALGRRLYEVDEWLLLAENEKEQLFLKKAMQEKDIHVLHLTKASIATVPVLNERPKILIANPKGYLILAYEEKTKPQDIYQDIKQLLNKSG